MYTEYLVISQGDIQIQVPFNFFEKDFPFTREHFLAIKKAAKLSIRKFAREYKFPLSEVISWGRYPGTVKPAPGARLRLLFIAHTLNLDLVFDI